MRWSKQLKNHEQLKALMRFVLLKIKILTENGLSTVGSPNGFSSKPDIFAGYDATSV